MHTAFLYNPQAAGSNAHCPHLMEAANGDLFAAWYAYPGSEDHRDGKLVLARKPAGSDWQKASLILDNLQSSAGNPVLVQSPGSEDLFLYFALLGNYWNDGELYCTHSRDRGHTWAPPAKVSDRRGYMIRHSPLPEPGGAVLLPVYDELDHTSHIYRCHGAQWSRCHSFDGLVIQPVLVRDGDVVRAFFRPREEPHIIWRAQSVDGGATWSELIRTSLPCPRSGLAAFCGPGALGVVYNHTEEHRRSPLSVATSGDGGVTWSRPWHIDAVANEASYPSFLVGSDGLVHGLFTYNRRMIKYIAFSLEELFHGIHGD